MIVIKRRDMWSPQSTPPPGVRPEYQVSTNGRGAVVYLNPYVTSHRFVLPQGGLGLKPPKVKEPMDPLDRSTWHRPYRFT